nr:MAG TPA: hypothetical protein [Caudoviricetes sp.]
MGICFFSIYLLTTQEKRNIMKRDVSYIELFAKVLISPP